MSTQKFELKKAVQSVNYIVRELGKGSHMSKLDVLKLIFLADRYHLRRYGRAITNDQYWAMPLGPVASSVKDVVELGSFLSETERSYAEQYLEPFRKKQVKSINDVDRNVLSETDVEALDVAISLTSEHSNLVEFTHEFPEWKKHEATLSPTISRVEMNLLDCFDKAPEDAEYCKASDRLVELNKEFYQDSLEISSLW